MKEEGIEFLKESIEDYKKCDKNWSMFGYIDYMKQLDEKNNKLLNKESD